MRNTTLCYLRRDDRWLMLHRVKKQGDANRDKWIGIGGGFEDGESPEDCLVREVFEETGYVLKSWRYRAIITFVSDRWETEYMHLFTADAPAGEPGECDEGTPEWVPIDEVGNLPIWEGDRLFLDKIAGDCPFFSMKLRYEGETLAGAWLDGSRIR